MSELKRKTSEQTLEVDQDSESQMNIVLKMSQIRSGVDNWTIYIGFLMIGLGSSIIGTAMYQIDWTIASAFEAFDISASVSVAKDLLSILLIPLLAALSDIYGRGIIIAASWAFIVASNYMSGVAPDYAVYSAASIVGGLGSTGYDLIVPIIFADFLQPKNRGFGFILIYLPNLIALGASIPVVAATEGTEKWRWLYHIKGSWILAFCLPILFTLFRLQNKAKGLLPTFNYSTASLVKVDWIGIVTLVVSMGFILIPFNFVQRYEEGWAAPAIFVPIIVGGLFLIAFFVWEIKFTKRPLVSYKLLANRGAMVMILVRAFGAFDGSFTWHYMQSYLQLTRDIPVYKVNEIYLGYRISWYLVGFATAFLLRRYPNVRPYVWFGIVVHGVGNGLALASRYPTSPTWFVILAEAVIGFGGGVFSCAGFVVLQSTVDFIDIASITAFDSLVGSVFGSAASALSNAIWNGTHSNNLKLYLLPEYHELIKGLLANNKYNESIPEEYKSRWILAMSDSQWLMCVISIAFSVLCFLVSLLLPPIDLEKCQQVMAGNIGDESTENNEKL